MRIAITLAIMLVAVSPAAAESPDPAAPRTHHRHHHHAASPAPEAVANPGAETVAPAPSWPGFKPYAPGEGDEDGLSRDPDDCEKGCIGGNPG